MPPTIRQATPDDTALLMQVVDMASEGILPAIWGEVAPEGTSGSEVGAAQVTAEEGDLSYRHGVVLEDGGTALGGMIGYALPPDPAPPDPEVPEMFVGIRELVKLVPGHWYINMVAISPEARGRGLGRALLDWAETQARQGGCPGVALIVAATNTGALHVYRRAGYRERARRPFDLSAFGEEPTEALLLVKALT